MTTIIVTDLVCCTLLFSRSALHFNAFFVCLRVRSSGTFQYPEEFAPEAEFPIRPCNATMVDEFEARWGVPKWGKMKRRQRRAAVAAEWRASQASRPDLATADGRGGDAR